MKIGIIKRTDGQVCINRRMDVNMSDEEYSKHLDYLISKSTNEFVSYRLGEETDLPQENGLQDRTFRNAWTDDLNTDTVDIDINKAHEIKKEQLRAAREPLLKALDVEVMKALESGQDVSALAAKKQELRDVTDLELPADIQELKEFVPDCLQSK